MGPKFRLFCVSFLLVVTHQRLAGQNTSGCYYPDHYFFDNDDIAHKLNPAGPQHEMIASLAGITDYLDVLAEHHLSNPPDDPRARAAAQAAAARVGLASSSSSCRRVGPGARSSRRG